MRIPGGERYPAGALSIETDLKGVLTGPRQGHIEHQDRPGFYVDDARRRLTELDRPLTTEKLRTRVVHESDANGVCADFRPSPSHPQDQVGARVDRGEVRKPDVLKHSEHAELALLVNQGVVGDDSEVEVQSSADSDGRDDVVLFDLVHHIHTFDHLAEDGVHLVEVRLR